MNDFWHRKLTLKVTFWHFLSPPHYTNLQNSMMSFNYSWFSAKNNYNFLSFPWKLHNQYCHIQRLDAKGRTISEILQEDVKIKGIYLGASAEAGSTPVSQKMITKSFILIQVANFVSQWWFELDNELSWLFTNRFIRTEVRGDFNIHGTKYF